MTKWIVFHQETGRYSIEDIEDVDKHIAEHTLSEILIEVDIARELIHENE